MTTFDDLISQYGDSTTLNSDSGSSTINGFAKKLSDAINHIITSNVSLQVNGIGFPTAKYVGDFEFSFVKRIESAITDGNSLNDIGIETSEHLANIFSSQNETLWKDLQEKIEYEINLPNIEVLSATILSDSDFKLREKLLDNIALEQTETNVRNTATIYGVKFNLKILKNVFKQFILSFRLDIRGNIKTKGETEIETLIYANNDLPKELTERAKALQALRDNLNKLKDDQMIHSFKLNEGQSQTVLETTVWENTEFDTESKIVGLK